MGLINYLQDEQDRTQRRADQQVARYNNKVTNLQEAMAPHQKTVEEYNAAVDQYNGGFYKYGNDTLFRTYNKDNFRVYSPISSTYENYTELHGAPAGYTPHFEGIAPSRSSQTTPYIYSFNKYAKPDSAAATAADQFLKDQQGAVESLQHRGEVVNRNVAREVERLETEIAFNQRKALEEQATGAAGNPNSVFDQNKAGVFQSISDWLKG